MTARQPAPSPMLASVRRLGRQCAPGVRVNQPCHPRGPRAPPRWPFRAPDVRFYVSGCPEAGCAANRHTGCTTRRTPSEPARVQAADSQLSCTPRPRRESHSIQDVRGGWSRAAPTSPRGRDDDRRQPVAGMTPDRGPSASSDLPTASDAPARSAALSNDGAAGGCDGVGRTRLPGRIRHSLRKGGPAALMPGDPSCAPPTGNGQPGDARNYAPHMRRNTTLDGAVRR